MTSRHRWGRSAAVVSAVLLATVGCGSAAGTPPDEPAYAATLQPQLEELAAEMLVTGAVVLVHSPELGDWTTTIGTRTFRGDDPVQIGDHVRVASNTKTWTGTVILQLVDEGRLRLDDPVATYRPDVPNGENITIAQLLDMRSGLSNYTQSFEVNNLNDVYPGKAWNPEELVAIGLSEPPQSAPGEAFFYSNTNTVLLGLIIEQVTGNPVAEEFRTRLFEPLGMTGTSYPEATSSALPEPFARGYTYGTNVGTIDTLAIPQEAQDAAAAGVITPSDVTDTNPSYTSTAGAGISTAEDLATWVEALAGGDLLSPQLQQQRLDSVVPTVPGVPDGAAYGLALARFGPLYGHTGELPGYNSFMGHDPERGITVVTWTSLAPAVDGRGPAVELAKTVIGELYGISAPPG